MKDLKDKKKLKANFDVMNRLNSTTSQNIAITREV